MYDLVSDQDQIKALFVEDIMNDAKSKHERVLEFLNECKGWPLAVYSTRRVEAEESMRVFTAAFELMLDYRTPLRLARLDNQKAKDKVDRQVRSARTRIANEFGDDVPLAFRKHVARVFELRGEQRFVQDAAAPYDAELKAEGAPHSGFSQARSLYGHGTTYWHKLFANEYQAAILPNFLIQTSIATPTLTTHVLVVSACSRMR
jgi:hypothetical protein